jgi:predicted nuclease of predicted toxin-antitoxin system
MTKLLLDESIPIRLAAHFPDPFVVSTVHGMGWRGTKNGELLRLASDNGFVALITADQGIEHQQNQSALPCAIVVLRSYRITLQNLIPLVPKVISLFQKGTIHGIHQVAA